MGLWFLKPKEACPKHYRSRMLGMWRHHLHHDMLLHHISKWPQRAWGSGAWLLCFKCTYCGEMTQKTNVHSNTLRKFGLNIKHLEMATHGSSSWYPPPSAPRLVHPSIIVKKPSACGSSCLDRPDNVIAEI